MTNSTALAIAVKSPAAITRWVAYFEAHIEQGPELEAQGRTIGIVTGVQGLLWHDVRVTGQDAHAGSTPMERRRDAMLAASKMIQAVNNIALQYTPAGRGTVGMVDVQPGSRNTIPGEVAFTVDLRHPDATALRAMDTTLQSTCAAIAASERVEVDFTCVEDTPPVVFDDTCIAAVQTASQRLDYSSLRMQSGAGHDACFLARVAPTSMIFVPCAEGLSHNELESAEPGDLEAGGNVLLHAMLALAGKG